MKVMSKDEWIETAIIFVALALLWVPILGLQQWWLRFALWACVPVLLIIAWRRWKRFNEALKSIQREDEIFRPLPPELRERLK
jgi:membrane protein implicated in regulation of membrane protease activity